MIVDLKHKKDSKKLLEHLREHRFIILRNHGINYELISDVYSEWEGFFADDRKVAYLRKDTSDEGFVPSNTECSPESEKPDPKEFFQTHADKSFPNIIIHKKTEELLNRLKPLAFQLIQSISPLLKMHNHSFDLENIVDLDSKSMFRIIHYPNSPKPKGADADFRAAPHGDICLFTMIPSPSSEGLEFVYENSKNHKVVCNKGDIIFFNSDMIELYTKGYLKSAKHLVSKQKEHQGKRYSCPLFIHAKRAVELDEGTQAIDAVRKRLSEIGYNGDKLER